MALPNAVKQTEESGGVRAGQTTGALRTNVPLFFFGTILIVTGLGLYFGGIVFSIVRLAFALGEPAKRWNEWIIWYSGVPFTFGLVLCLLDIAFLLPEKRRSTSREVKPVGDRKVVVALTAYNDEASIGQAVADFESHPLVQRVIVVDNNSEDATAERAREAGAWVAIETKPGYGRCVYRCFEEALRVEGSALIVLCEGDLTFRAADLEKLLAYIDHADIVNGTRIVEQLRDYTTQLSSFMYFGNFFVGKLLEAKHIGRGTFTDVGTTYKLIRRESLERLMPVLRPEINLEFNAHFMDTALAHGERLVECPITFHTRVGKSKGGNVNDMRALWVGLRMIWGLCTGWR